MPFVNTNGLRVSYQRSGRGVPVLFIMGSSASGRVWTMHQTPALNAAGYETVTFDNRGIRPTDVPPGDYTLGDMVADTRGLIEQLELGPCHVVGTSLGSMVVQELALDHPEMIRSAVLIASRAISGVGESESVSRTCKRAQYRIRRHGLHCRDFPCSRSSEGQRKPGDGSPNILVTSRCVPAF
ncbi:alpha/beta fold hydrolase [Streptomyces sp. NPDC002690]